MNFKNKIKSKPFHLFVTLLALVVTVTTVSSCNPDEEQKISTKFESTFADEFDKNGALNSDLWTYDIGTGDNGWGNNELQYYTDRPENVVVENGMLKITAIKENFEGSGYTSARILTKGLFKQKYGRF